MKFTGERYMQEDIPNENIAREHWHRYLWANTFVENKTVLDIACGSGYGSNYLAKTASRVIGADISQECVEYSKSLYKKENLDFKVMNSNNLDLADNSIDVIVSFETIEHMDENSQLKTLEEYSRVLKNDGTLLITTPGIESPRHFQGNEFHLKEYSYEEFNKALSKHFKYIKIIGQSIYTTSVIGACADSAKVFNSKFPVFDTIKEYNPKEDKYLIAICSNQPLEDNTSSILIDRATENEAKSFLKTGDQNDKQKPKRCLCKIIKEMIKINLFFVCSLFSKKSAKKLANSARRLSEKLN